MTVERTDIQRNATTNKDIEKFCYMLLVQRKNETQKQQLHRSRATILERPCWRDDPASFIIKDPLDEFYLQVIAIKKKNKGDEIIYDEVQIPNLLLEYKNQFLNSSVLELEVISDKLLNHKYLLKIEWDIG